jgi:hypothetical protein
MRFRRRLKFNGSSLTVTLNERGFGYSRLLQSLFGVIYFSVKTVNFKAVKEQKARARMAILRKARRSPQEAAKIQRRVSLFGGNAAKWRITNFKEVTRAMARWA